MGRDGSTLPAWIPFHARRIYTDTGPYTDSRMEQAMHDLFHADALCGLFRYLHDLPLYGNAWPHLIGCIVNAAECVPVGGAATNDRPDFKLRTRAKQAVADGLLAKIAETSLKLSGLLDELDELRAETPGETYSSLALIESAISQKAVRSEFEQFKTSLSSRQRHDFPTPADLLSVLAEAAMSHPSTREIFADDPWLGSQKSTWIDFVRILDDELEQMHEMFGVAIKITPDSWVSLVNAVIAPSVDAESMRKAIPKAAQFSCQKQKK